MRSASRFSSAASPLTEAPASAGRLPARQSPGSPRDPLPQASARHMPPEVPCRWRSAVEDANTAPLQAQAAGGVQGNGAGEELMLLLVDAHQERVGGVVVIDRD